MDPDEFKVSVTDWGTGTGYTVLQVEVKCINEAVIVKEALEKIYPHDIVSTCGENKIRHVYKVEIRNNHRKKTS